MAEYTSFAAWIRKRTKLMPHEPTRSSRVRDVARAFFRLRRLCTVAA